ncbi:glycosyltransferase family 2 protein [Cesiribacter andamanensis]|uniref:glycosyltransferase family 2 protein n=1 Tax=Cesiribacter andamanensis TaxID=649507 RepID=UPI00034ABB43|nr:glycosyltransferase family 2 protein [Cesiribacter andamanensis]
MIIPTFNGAHKILTVLHALERQSYQCFETIIVVDGSTDHTVALLETASVALSPFRIVVQENKGRAAVRNRGAREANGELLIFFDDDMRPEPDCVKQHLLHHEQVPNSIGVGITPEDPARCITDVHRYKAHLSYKWTRPLVNVQGPLPEPLVFLAAANFSVPNKLFLELGGFNEQLRDAEDQDLALRAVQANVPVYFLEQALSWHDDFFTLGRFIYRQREYQANHRLLAQLNPAYAPPPATTPGKGKQALLALFRHPWWIKAIDGANPFSLLPKKLRYKLYDVVVYANTLKS